MSNGPPSPPSSPRLRAHVIREIAVEAACDPRSVEKVAGGGRVRTGTVDERIRAALRVRGLFPTDPTEKAP